MTLVDGGLYKIINLSSAKPASILLPGYDGGDGLASNKIYSYTDNNWDTQKWLAKKIGGNTWALKSAYEDNGTPVYLGFSVPDKGPYVIWTTDECKWDINIDALGGAVYSLSAHGNDSDIIGHGTEIEPVLDLFNGEEADTTPINLWQPNGSVAQLWLFQELPMPKN